MDVYLYNILSLRGDKTSRTLNLDDLTNATNNGAIETMTIMRDVPIETIRESCALLGYYLNLNFRFESANFSGKHELSDVEREQFDVLSSIDNFDDYTRRCRTMLERVIKKGRRIFEIENITMNANDVNGNDNNENTSDEEKQEKSNRFTLIHAMNGIFNNFYDLITNESLPSAIVYERLFVSQCLSKRPTLKLYREHLCDLNALFSILTKTMIDTIDRCNTLFEAFYQTGILFTALVDLIVYNDTTRNKPEKDESRNWTRVRLLNPDDREAVHFIKNTTTTEYRRAVERLPENLFDKQSGLDVYLSINDTFSTLMSQFIGRMYLRLYEWIERSDVKQHLMEYFTCDNVHTLFANIGRGHDQRNWIRFFKRTNNRETKLFIKLEPLLTLNDEMIIGNEDRQTLVGTNNNNNGTDGSSSSSTASLLTNSVQLRSTVTQDVARRYHLLNDFLKRYNGFTENDRTGKLNALWNIIRTSFVQRSCGFRLYDTTNDDQNKKNNINGFLQSFDQETSPLLSFKAWCEEINTSIFPFNFLLLTLGSQSVNPNEESFDKETLDLAWIYRCQKYLMMKRFTSSKCRQILTFLQQFEIKSRMVAEEREFMFVISSALENMPFIYELFTDLTSNDDFLIENPVDDDTVNANNSHTNNSPTNESTMMDIDEE